MATASASAPLLVCVKSSITVPNKLGDCSFCQRVLLTLEEKHLPYELKLVDLANKREWFLKINAQGKVPVLKLDQEWIADSDIITQTLEDKYPDPPLTTSPDKASVFVKSKDPKAGTEKALLDELTAFNDYLKEHGSFVNGEKVSSVDLSLAPKLYHMEIALAKYKDWSVPDSLPYVKSYMKNSQQYHHDVCIPSFSYIISYISHKLLRYGGTITNQIKRLGASCDWTREHFTLDEKLSRAVVEAFVELHEKGLIDQGSYMVNWSPSLQTAVSDLEVEYQEESGSLYYIKYRVAGGSKIDFLTVATTRPETLFGDVAIAVHPEDDRYSKYINRMAIVPMTYGRHVPIISDKHVDREFGTGVLKISPGHDHNDYNLAKKLGLPILTIMNKDETLNKVAGLYCGLDRFEARKKLWTELEETGLAVKKKPHTLRVPRSQRGGEVIEPLVSKQWFVTMEPLAEKALDAVEKGELKIIPERFEKIYNHWLSNIKDWCISGQFWWGHRIPVWYIVGKDCEEEYIVARSYDEALDKAQEKYGRDAKIYQDPDVLDTWFSSALWPFSTLGWPDVSTDDFKLFYPTSMLETGHDILFFWVARMVMMGIEFTGAVPFSHIYLHGLIRDPEGRKMSKTLGNVIDPLDTIKEYGTDALRFTLALGTAGQDLNLSPERLTSDKAFTNKLWNAGKFVFQSMPSQNDASSWENILSYKFDKVEFLDILPLPERWVISKLHLLIDSVTASYDKYFFGDIGRDIQFFLGYIEASKARLFQSGNVTESSVSRAVLLYVFENILKLLPPFMPFVTEELWQALPNRTEALIASTWPLTSLPRQTHSIKQFENLQALTRAIRNARAEYTVEPVKRISASIVANVEVTEYIMKEKVVLALLSRLDLQSIYFTDSPPGNADQSVHLVAGEGLEAYLPLADMVDISSEIERLSK